MFISLLRNPCIGANPSRTLDRTSFRTLRTQTPWLRVKDNIGDCSTGKFFEIVLRYSAALCSKDSFFFCKNPSLGVFIYFGGATYALLDAVGRRSTASCSSPELLSLSITRILFGARFVTWGRTYVSWGTEAALRLPM